MGPRGLCRLLDEKQGFPTNNSLSTLSGLLRVSSDGTFGALEPLDMELALGSWHLATDLPEHPGKALGKLLGSS